MAKEDKRIKSKKIKAKETSRGSKSAGKVKRGMKATSDIRPMRDRTSAKRPSSTRHAAINGPRDNGVNPQAPVVEISIARKKKIVKAPRKKGGAEIVVLAICFFLFIVSIGGSLISFVTKETIATMNVPYGSVDIPMVINGIIIRDEKVYTAPAAGEVSYSVADNEKVRNGALVCSIKDASNTEYLESQSKDLSQKILDMQNQRAGVSAVSTEVNTINSKIKTEIDKTLLSLSSSDFSSMYKLKENLEKNINARNGKLLNENGGAVEAYVNEYRQYTNKIAESIAGIYVEGGGVVSYVVDGFENILNFDSLSAITKDQTQMKVDTDSFVQAKTVDSEDEVFKIIQSNDWYIAAYLDNELIAGWSESSTVTIYIEKDGEYEQQKFKVYRLTPGEKESYVVLKSNSQLLKYIDMRTISFKTYDSIYNGLKIPESAICERTFLKIPVSYVIESQGNDVVNKKNGDKTERVTITRKYLKGIEGEEDYIYIMQDFDNIKRGDTIVAGDEDTTGYVINEIVPSKGVFKTNTGIAAFVSINTEGMAKGNKGYVILDTAVNGGTGGLNVYDRIVTDAINNYIKEGDVIT